MVLEEGRFCPVCKLKNEPEAQACAYCGANLTAAPANSYPTTEMIGAGTVALSKPSEFKTDALIPRGAIAFFQMDSVKPVAVTHSNEIILGRLMEGGEGDSVDLTPYGAFDLGVSRRHARVHRKEQGYELIDLESTNGTSVDATRLQPSQPYDLKSGNVIWLARFPLRVVFIDDNQEKPALPKETG